jgi:hypothetical protein
MMSHSEGELWGLAAHPTREIYATASYDGKHINVINIFPVF